MLFIGYEHFIASVVCFTKMAEREMFMHLDTHRFFWLKKKHEWMNKNDVAKWIFSIGFMLVACNHVSFHFPMLGLFIWTGLILQFY